jgi:hypothetical protein
MVIDLLFVEGTYIFAGMFHSDLIAASESF